MSICHSFDIEIAQKHGVIGAVLIQNFQFWIIKNRANQSHFYDGRTWTYNTIAALAEQFPYLTQDQVRRAVDKLAADGVLIKGNYNSSAYNRRLWYAFADESIWLPCQPHLTNLPATFDESAKCYTDIKTDINTVKKQKHKRARGDAPPVELPDWLPADTWSQFIESRKKLKKPMTDHAQNLAIKALGKLRNQGNDPVAVIEQSVINGWSGLFEVKNGKNSSGNPKQRQRGESVVEHVARVNGFVRSENGEWIEAETRKPTVAAHERNLWLGVDSTSRS